MVEMKVVKTMLYKGEGYSITFTVGDDIAFTYEGERYIVEVESIEKNCFVGGSIEINGKRTDIESKVFIYEKMMDCNIPDGGFY